LIVRKGATKKQKWKKGRKCTPSQHVPFLIVALVSSTLIVLLNGEKRSSASAISKSASQVREVATVGIPSVMEKRERPSSSIDIFQVSYHVDACERQFA
jgi:hypothetical protein